MYTDALYCQPMVIEWEMLKEQHLLFHCGKSWVVFWEDLEKLEHLLTYKDRVLMHKQVDSQGGPKNLKPAKKKGSEVKESQKGGVAGRGGKGGGGG